MRKQVTEFENDLYTIRDTSFVRDDKVLKTVSETVLKGWKSTRGHKHEDQAETYIFIEGLGVMLLNDQEVPAVDGMIVHVDSGVFHKVVNVTEFPLRFYAIFDGEPKRPLLAPAPRLENVTDNNGQN